MDVDLTLLCQRGRAGAQNRPFLKQLPLPSSLRRPRRLPRTEVPLPPMLRGLYRAADEEYYFGNLTFLALPYVEELYWQHPLGHVLLAVEREAPTGRVLRWHFVPQTGRMYADVTGNGVVVDCTVGEFVQHYARALGAPDDTDQLL
jgi:hypothetical protein